MVNCLLGDVLQGVAVWGLAQNTVDVGKHCVDTIKGQTVNPQNVGFTVVSEWADYAICSVVTQVPPSSEVSRGTSPVLPSCSMVMVPFLSAGSQ